MSCVALLLTNHPPSATPPFRTMAHRDGHSDVIPDRVRHFLTEFNSCFSAGKLSEVRRMYENEFPRFSESTYSASRWPTLDALEGSLDDGACAHSVFSWMCCSQLPSHLPLNYLRAQWAFRSDCSIESCTSATFSPHQSPRSPCPCGLSRGALTRNCLQSLQVRAREAGSRFRAPSPVQPCVADGLLDRTPVPNEWLYDLFDEFVFQFIAHKQTWFDTAKRDEGDVAFLKEHSSVSGTPLGWMNGVVRACAAGLRVMLHFSIA